MSPQDPQIIHQRRWKILAVLSLSLVIIGLDNTVLNVALPTLQRTSTPRASTLQWIVDAYLLVFAGLLLTMGTLGDRFGRKRALQAGLAVFGAAQPRRCARLETSDQLIAVRALMGVGGALIMPATLSIITNIFPREERGKAIGVWAGMAAVGIGLGPLVGGLLLEWFSWRVGVLAQRPGRARRARRRPRASCPDSRDPKPGAFDLVGALLSVGALVALVYGDHRGAGRGLARPAHRRAASASRPCSARVRRLGAAARRRRCSTSASSATRASASRRSAISSASFALMARSSLITQYLQFAHGYIAARGRRGDGAARVRARRRRRRARTKLVRACSARPASSRAGCSRLALVLERLAALVAAHGLLGARAHRVRRRVLDGQRHGAGDRLRHGRGRRGEGRASPRR